MQSGTTDPLAHAIGTIRGVVLNLRRERSDPTQGRERIREALTGVSARATILLQGE